MTSPLSALLVDPALFTEPYDAALTLGLEHARVEVRWATRPPRAGDDGALDTGRSEFIYYRGLEATSKGLGAGRKLRKALSHLQGGRRLQALVARGCFDVVHFQWAVLPLFDGLVMARLKRRAPVILTVHDLEPFNGSPTSRAQLLGFDRALKAASRLIVHTESARAALIARGCAPGSVVHVPHGPLRISGRPPRSAPRRKGERWRVVLFGKLQGYKGVDVLVEALGLMAPEVRSRLEVVVAGEPLIAMEPLVARARALKLDRVLRFQLQRLTEEEMAELLGSADAFVFPYRNIEASGVLHLVLPLERWIVASDVGAFRELVLDGVNGERTPAGDPERLADALTASIGRRPDPVRRVEAPGWNEIGRRTREVYEEALASRPTAA